MATTYSANARLQKPGTSDRQWDIPINANTDALDAMTAIGSLVVTTTEAPSASLQVRVSPGAFIRPDGTVGSFAGNPAIAVPAAATTCLWLDGAGVLAAGPAFPATAHVRLAIVTAGGAAIATVADARVQCGAAGAGAGFVLKAGDTIAGPLTVGATAPVLVADPANRLLGFFGAAPAGPAAALNPLAVAGGGTGTDVVADGGASFSQATLNNNFASLTAKVDALIAALKRHGLMAS